LIHELQTRNQSWNPGVVWAPYHDTTISISPPRELSLHAVVAEVEPVGYDARPVKELDTSFGNKD
jgi:hypothetical protein